MVLKHTAVTRSNMVDYFHLNHLFQPVPFVQNIPGGIYPGKMIYVSGIPHPGGSR